MTRDPNNLAGTPPDEALRQSETRYRSLFENMAEGLAHCRMVFEDGQPRDSIYLAVNPAFEKLTGLRDAVGKKASEVIPGIRETNPELLEIYGRVSLSGQPERFETFVGALNHWFSVSVYSPEKEHFVAVFDVITERKRAQEALRASELRYRRLFETAKDGVLILDAETGIVVDVNPFLAQLLGFSHEALLGKKIWELGSFKDIVANRARFEELQQQEYIRYDDKPLQAANGRQIAVEFVSNVYQVNHHKVIQCNIRDITERKQAEKALQALSSRQEAILAAVPDIIMEVDRHKVYSWANQAGLDFFGEDVIGKEAAFYFEGEQGTYQSVQPLFDSRQELVHIESWQRRKDGEKRLLSWWCRAVKDELGNVTGALSSARDITERNRAETALRDAESLYQSLVEHLPQSVFRKDREGRFTYVNSRFCALMGKTPGELLGKKASDFLPRDLAERVRQDDQRVMQTQTVFDAVEDHLLAGNPKIVLHVLKAPVCNALGEITGVQGILADISGQTELEAKFLRVQRLDSIGSLASGIAHDLNNILAPIMMCAPLLRGARSSEEREQMISLIEASTQRAASIVKQLLSFGRGQAGQKTALQVRHLLGEVGKIARETFPRSIQVEADVSADLWLVSGDSTQLHQVLLNLCVNARDAMPSGGKLTLRAENVTLDENYVCMHQGVSAGPFIRIQVQDTGTGIPESTREHIFDSFYTTKSQDQGTGLGLTTVLGIVRNHHGFITFTTAVGKGTTFEIYLPAQPEAQPSSLPEPPPAASPRGRGELILLVDDEPAIGTAARRTLEKHGYAVLRAEDGVEALALFTSRRADIRAVVTDFMMPHMDGLTLSRILTRLSPQTPIIVSSGGLMAKDSANSLQALGALGIRHILHKPHNAEVLLQALADVLHPAAQPPRGRVA
jgi:PAS domain S-box-containing protein